MNQKIHQEETDQNTAAPQVPPPVARTASQVTTVDHGIPDWLFEDSDGENSETADSETSDSETSDSETSDSETSDSETSDSDIEHPDTEDSNTADSNTAENATENAETEDPILNLSLETELLQLLESTTLPDFKSAEEFHQFLLSQFNPHINQEVLELRLLQYEGLLGKYGDWTDSEDRDAAAAGYSSSSRLRALLDEILNQHIQL
jgi:hypothetical protein